MNLCATDFPPGVSEIEALGIKTAKSTLVEPPRIAAAPFAFECRRSMSLVFHETRELLIGEVLAIHARSDLTDAKTLCCRYPHRYRPIGRLAGSASAAKATCRDAAAHLRAVAQASGALAGPMRKSRYHACWGLEADFCHLNGNASQPHTERDRRDEFARVVCGRGMEERTTLPLLHDAAVLEHDGALAGR